MRSGDPKNKSLDELLFYKKPDAGLKQHVYNYDLVVKENKTQLPIMSFRVEQLTLKCDAESLRVKMHKALDLVLDGMLEKFK